MGQLDRPDEGVWETRGGRKDFTYGRLMCWAALDRAIRMAGERGRPGDLQRWVDTPSLTTTLNLTAGQLHQSRKWVGQQTGMSAVL